MKIIIIILLVCITGCSTISGRKVVFDESIKVDFKLEGKPLDRKGFKIKLLNTSDSVFIKQNDSGFNIVSYASEVDTLNFEIEIDTFKLENTISNRRKLSYNWDINIDINPIECKYFFDKKECNIANEQLSMVYRVYFDIMDKYRVPRKIIETAPRTYFIVKKELLKQE